MFSSNTSVVKKTISGVFAFYQCTVYETKNQIVGFCILQPVLDEANLLLMAIHPSQQGKGLGYELLDYSIQL